MLLSTERIKTLANYCKESAQVPSFGLKKEENVKIACVAIAKAGVAVDMEYFMDVFYFNFKSKKDYDKAVAAIAKKINREGEDEFK